MLDKLIAGALQGIAAPGRVASPLMQVVGSLLSNGGPCGGLAGLVQQFQRAGLGQQVASWISNGTNMPVSVEQLTKALGSERLQQMAASAGLEPARFGETLAQLLPECVDRLTPAGQMPTGGVEDPLAALATPLRR